MKLNKHIAQQAVAKGYTIKSEQIEKWLYNLYAISVYAIPYKDKFESIVVWDGFEEDDSGFSEDNLFATEEEALNDAITTALGLINTIPTAETIKQKAAELEQEHKEIYEEFCRQNPGHIMHGSLMKIEVLRKAQFATSIEDLQAMQRCFEIELRSMEGNMNGFSFLVAAIKELLEYLKQ